MFRIRVPLPHLLGTAVGALVLAALSADDVRAQTLCYVPDVGVVYVIGEAGLPDACRDASHVRLPLSGGGGTITEVLAGAGLLGGGQTGSILLEVDPGTVQYRVTEVCAAGSSIRAINEDGTVVCEADDVGSTGSAITEVAAGTGLTGGGTTGVVTLSVDPTAVQTRVSGTCANGSSIRAIAEDGTVTCEVDDVGSGGSSITEVVAGTGLTGGGTTGVITLDVDPTAVQTRVGGTCAAGSSIRTVAQNGSVTCEVDDEGVTGVVAGTGLTGGGSTPSVTLNVDPAAVQNRVTGACAVGSMIRSIAQDGSVTCEPGGFSNIQIVFTDGSNQSGPRQRIDRACPGGTSVIGGGGFVVGSSGANIPAVALQASYPIGNGWSAEGYEVVATSALWRVRTYAICVN